MAVYELPVKGLGIAPLRLPERTDPWAPRAPRPRVTPVGPGDRHAGSDPSRYLRRGPGVGDLGITASDLMSMIPGPVKVGALVVAAAGLVYLLVTPGVSGRRSGLRGYTRRRRARR